MTDTPIAATPRRWRARDHIPSALLFLVGVAISIAIASFVRARARAAEERILQRRVVDVSAALGASETMWLELLHQLDSFFRSSDEVTRADFRDFVRPALQRHPEVAALEWFPLVRGAAERSALEARAHADGLPAYVVREVGDDGTMARSPDRDQHLPLYYMEPVDDSAMGLDLYATPLRRAPADRARDTGEPVVSQRIRLVEDPADVYSVALHVPIYRRGEPITTEAQRRAAFIGVAVEVFRLKPTLERALAAVDVRGLHVALEDENASGDERMLFAAGSDPGDDALTARKPLAFGGRQWVLAFAAAPGGLVSGVAPAAVLLGGVVIALVASLLLSAWRMILRLRREVEAATNVGQYTLLERIGAGGMGVVYKARHALLRRPTAVKILQRDRASEADLKRFEREVQITGQLTHPNTVVVFDYGRTPDRRFYYAMEYINGVTLEALVARFGPQPPGRVVHILVQALGALAEAHAAGLIHRDVKPANFMLCQRGGEPDVVKVLDFGMVKERGIVSDVSETGVSYGTPLYLPPEAIKDPRALDARADLYALGLVAYYLLCGQRAVTGVTLAEVMHEHLTVVPPAPSERLGAPIPVGLEKLIMKCLAKSPDDRPASADALRRALLELDDVTPWTGDAASTWWATFKDEIAPSTSSPIQPRPLTVAMTERER